MRILIMPSSYLPVLGGVQTVAHNLAQVLQKRNHKVWVVTNRYPRKLSHNEIIDGIHVHRMLFLSPHLDQLRNKRLDLFVASLFYYPTTMLWLLKWLWENKPEIINVHFPDAQIPFILWLRRWFHFHLVVSLHGHEIERWFKNEQLLPNKISNGGVKIVALRKLLRLADAVTACSNYLLNQAGLLEPCVLEKGVVIHNGIDLDRFKNKTPYVHPSPYLFSYGRLVYKKGFDLLLTAFSEVVKDYPSIDLILAGEGEMKKSLIDQAVKLGIKSKVYFFGRATPFEIVELVNGCLMVVVPSRQEPFGITALEAKVAGVPLLVTRVGGMPEFLNDFEADTVEPTVNGLLYGLRDMLSRSQNKKKNISNSSESFDNYSWDRVTFNYEKMFCRVLDS